MSRLPVIDEGSSTEVLRQEPDVDFAGNALVVTLGCAKNLVDSEVMLGALQGHGFSLVTDADQADLIVVNTCAFLQSAVDEGIDRILELSSYRSSGRCRRLVVAGCMVERYREELKKALPEVDQFLSTDELLDVAGNTATSDNAFSAARRPYFLYDDTTPRIRSTAGHTAYVKIAEGCDRPCAFCIIPKIRGSFRSRKVSSVVEEVGDLLEQGVREINLVAQDLTAYGTDFEGNRGIKSALPELLTEISSFDPVDYWLRLFYAYPIGVNEELIKLISETPAICNYLDLPLQHISGPVLKGMQRPLGEKGTRGLIEQIRTVAPELALRTTFVVGFPGETEEDVSRLEEFISAGHFTHVGVFAYSQEEEARSYSFSNQVPEELREERRERLMQVQQEVVARRLAEHVGQTFKVLVEGTHSETDLLFTARTEWQGPEMDGEVIINEVADSFSDEEGLLASLQGQFVNVEITDVAGYDLVGKLVSLPDHYKGA